MGTGAKQCEHCYCRTRTVAVDVWGAAKRRICYCCWCGDEKTVKTTTEVK